MTIPFFSLVPLPSSSCAHARAHPPGPWSLPRQSEKMQVPVLALAAHQTASVSDLSNRSWWILVKVDEEYIGLYVRILNHLVPSNKGDI